jgi:hypothetical protein
MIFGFRSPAADMDRVDILGNRHLRVIFHRPLGRKICCLLLKVFDDTGYFAS